MVQRALWLVCSKGSFKVKPEKQARNIFLGGSIGVTPFSVSKNMRRQSLDPIFRPGKFRIWFSVRLNKFHFQSHSDVSQKKIKRVPRIKKKSIHTHCFESFNLPTPFPWTVITQVPALWLSWVSNSHHAACFFARFVCRRRCLPGCNQCSMYSWHTLK